MGRAPSTGDDLTAEHRQFLREMPAMPDVFRSLNDGCSFCRDRKLGPRGWADLKRAACDLHDWLYRYCRRHLVPESTAWEYARRMADEIFYVYTLRELRRVGWPGWLARWYAGARFRVVRRLGTRAATAEPPSMAS